MKTNVKGLERVVRIAVGGVSSGVSSTKGVNSSFNNIIAEGGGKGSVYLMFFFL